MKVFISWSGEVSRQAALALREWLPFVLNVLEPYVSAEDIDKGARWGSDIATQLESSNFGILCLTPDNQHAPWLNFEAGALAKSMSVGRVSPLLLNMTPADIVGPLAQFQATRIELNDVERLLRSLNAASDKPLADSRVTESVAVWWPRLEPVLHGICTMAPPPATPPRDVREMMAEVLELVRNTRRIVVERENGLAAANALINGRSRVELAVIKIGAQELLREHGQADAKVRLLGDTIVVASAVTLPADVGTALRRLAEESHLKLRFAVGDRPDPWDML